MQHAQCKMPWPNSKDHQKKLGIMTTILRWSWNLKQIFRLTVANADLAMARGETDTALNTLRSVGPEQAYFVQVKTNILGNRFFKKIQK